MAHILAIDDDEAMLILIKNALRKDGHEVTGVTQVCTPRPGLRELSEE